MVRVAVCAIALENLPASMLGNDVSPAMAWVGQSSDEYLDAMPMNAKLNLDFLVRTASVKRA